MSNVDQAAKRDMVLTTSDNPWNPHTHYQQWYKWDMDHGYNTLGYLANLCPFSPGLSDADNEYFIDQAVDLILKENINGKYTLI